MPHTNSSNAASPSPSHAEGQYQWRYFNRYEWLVILFAITICIIHIVATTPADFAIDIDVHHGYLKFLVDHGRLPHVLDGLEGYYHLPTYYVLSTPLYHLAQAIGVDPLQMVRIVSFVCYAIYLLIALSLLSRFLPNHGSSYYLALAMLALWPVGVLSSGRVHPEILSYIGHIGLLFSLLMWVARQHNNILANAFIFCGIFLLARNYALFFLIELMLFFTYALYQQRKTLRQLLSCRMLLSMAFCFACYMASSSHSTMAPNVVADQSVAPWSLGALLGTFLYFNPLLFVTETALDPHIGQSLDHHQHYFWRSMLLGSFTNFKAWPIVFAITNVWFALMMYVLLSAIYAWRRLGTVEKRVFGLAIFSMVMMGGMSMGARYFHPHIPSISDARYVFPFVTLFILSLGRILQTYEADGRTRLASIGKGLALGIILLSVALFVGEHLIL